MDPGNFAHPDDVSPAHLTTFGVIVDGVHYAGGCPTRAGPHPYCADIGLPSYSIAKSTLAALGLMRLEKSHPGTRARIAADFVPECAANGTWPDVTFEHLLDMAVGYANQRVVFGEKPIGAYQAIQHPLADLRIRLEAARGLTYKAAAAYDAGIDPAETGAYSNMAKYLASDLAIDAADRAIQTHGGAGFSEDVGVIAYWERTRLMRTAPISKEMILNYVGEHILGLPRSY